MSKDCIRMWVHKDFKTVIDEVSKSLGMSQIHLTKMIIIAVKGIQLIKPNLTCDIKRKPKSNSYEILWKQKDEKNK